MNGLSSSIPTENYLPVPVSARVELRAQGASAAQPCVWRELEIANAIPLAPERKHDHMPAESEKTNVGRNRMMTNLFRNETFKLSLVTCGHENVFYTEFNWKSLLRPRPSALPQSRVF